MNIDLKNIHPRAFSVVGVLIVILVIAASAVTALAKFVGPETWQAHPAWLLVPFATLAVLVGGVLWFTYRFVAKFGAEELVHTARAEVAVNELQKTVRSVRESDTVSDEDGEALDSYLAELRDALGIDATSDE